MDYFSSINAIEMCETKCLTCEELKTKVAELEAKVARLEIKQPVNQNSATLSPVSTTDYNFNKCYLSNAEIERYSRQIILPEISVTGQVNITKASVLIVGAGGLGCPSAQYLAAAGVGHIGIVDYDVVDLSNLHRQIIHTEDTIGIKKVESIANLVKRLNSGVQTTSYAVSLTSQNALTIIQKYDVILDCTDNVATRYLLNDACVFAKKTLVSGSALRFEGQLTVYNYKNGPCYRCLYPKPPPAETVTNCSDGGVLGAVTGVIGSLQALEAIKIITQNDVSYSGKLLLFDGLSGTFRNIKLRGKKENCVVCSKNPTITTLQDYEQFCGTKASDKETKLNLLQCEQRVTVKPYSITSSRLIKQEKLRKTVRSLFKADRNHENITQAIKNQQQIIFVCKRGNDSQKAVSHILKSYQNNGLTDQSKIKDIIGGLHSWSREIDNLFPVY